MLKQIYPIKTFPLIVSTWPDLIKHCYMCCIQVILVAHLCRRNYSYTQDLYWLSGKTSYCKISRSLEAARFGFKLFQSLWNLAGTSAALLPRCLSNFRAIRPLQHPISRLRDFTRIGGKASYRLVNRGPGLVQRDETPLHWLVTNGFALAHPHSHHSYKYTHTHRHRNT